MNSQTYWKMMLSSLLQLYLFNNNRIQQNIIKETKRTILLHIASLSCAKEFFCIAGLCAAEVEAKGILHSCCAKVNINLVDNGNI